MSTPLTRALLTYTSGYSSEGLPLSGGELDSENSFTHSQSSPSLSSTSSFVLATFKCLKASPLAAAAFFILYAFSSALAAYATTLAAHSAHLANLNTHSSHTLCATRASLFFVIGAVCMVVDFASMLVYLQVSTDMPSPWDNATPVRRAINKSISHVVPMTVAAFTLGIVPVIIWLRDGGLADFAGAAVLLVLIYLAHNTVNAITFHFQQVYLEDMESAFLCALKANELDYDAAVNAYSDVNANRKKFGRSVSRGFFSFFLCYLLMQAVVLYDAELRPWGGWPFFLIFVANTCVTIMAMEPFIGLNDWPDEVAKDVMECRELGWNPTERSNFWAHLRATRVSISVFDFEMSHTFRTALPFLFVGWWLYMTELRQFHEFKGFDFDTACGTGGRIL